MEQLDLKSLKTARLNWKSKSRLFDNIVPVEESKLDLSGLRTAILNREILGTQQAHIPQRKIVGPPSPWTTIGTPRRPEAGYQPPKRVESREVPQEGLPFDFSRFIVPSVVTPSITDPKDVTLPKPTETEPMRLRAAEPSGYRPAAKPSDWQYYSPIEKFTWQLDNNRLNYILERFGRQFANAWSRAGEGIISHPLSPIGVRQKEINAYLPQVNEQLDKAGFSGSPAEREILARQRASELAASAKMPKFKVEPSAEISEKATDVAAGLSAFISQLALTKRIMPAGTPDAVIWEAQNAATGGIPGEGAAMRLTLGQIGRIPTGSLPGKLAKVGLESGLFAGYTAVTGGNAEDIIISGLIPVAFNTWTFAKQRRHIITYEKNLRNQALQSHQKRLREGMNFATSEAYLKADMRVVDNAVAKAKQTVYSDDAFAPAKEKWEAQRQRALDMISKGGVSAKQGQQILDFMVARPGVPEQRIKLPTTRAGEVAETVKEAVRHPVKTVQEITAKTRPVMPTEAKPITPVVIPVTPKVVKTEKPIFGSEANQAWRDRMSVSELEEIWESLNKPTSKATKKEISNWRRYIDWRKSEVAEREKPTAEITLEEISPILEKAQRNGINRNAIYVAVDSLKDLNLAKDETLRAYNMLAEGKTAEQVREQITSDREVAPPTEAKRPSEMTTDELYETFRNTKITNPQWQKLYDEVQRRKAIEKKPDIQPEISRLENEILKEAGGDTLLAIQNKATRDNLTDEQYLNRLRIIQREEAPEYAKKPEPLAEGDKSRRREILQNRLKRGETVPPKLLKEFIAEDWAQEALLKKPTAPEAKQPWEMTREEYENTPDFQRVYGKTEGKNRQAALSVHAVEVEEAVEQGKPVPRHVLEEYKSEEWAKKELAKAKYEFVVGDVIDTKGHSNMADPITIRAIQGNTLKFTDAEGVEYAGMARAVVRRLIEGGSWKRVIDAFSKKALAKEALIEKPKIYKGKAYRNETGLVIKGRTAADVVRFEQEELGNKLGITPEKLSELENIPSDRVVWVAREKETAAEYVSEGEKPDVQDYTEIVKGGEILTEIPDGVLVLISESPQAVGYGTVDNINVTGLSGFFREKMAAEPAERIDNAKVKKWTASALAVPESDLTPEKGYSHKKVQEAFESAIVENARDIIAEGGDVKDIYNKLVDLYERQPVLMQRTGATIQRQAYSTPAPLAFITSELADIDENTTVYEPTAGTGMLTIGAEPANVTVNEIDPTRFELLQTQGYKKVIREDAREYKSTKTYDAVVMNPPFGKHAEKVYAGHRLSHIEHIIAVENLKAMKDSGKAVIIVAAPKRLGYYPASDWVFGNYLYSHYNVVADFQVSGELYRRQGAAWPVRIIAISGRQKSEKISPKSEKFRAKTWQEVYNVLETQAHRPEIELPEGWRLKSEEGRWRVLDVSGRTIAELQRQEDGSFVLVEGTGEKGELGFPEQKSFADFNDALKALSEAAIKSYTKKTGKQPAIKREKINVIPTTAKPMPRRAYRPRRRVRKAAKEVERVRKPAVTEAERIGEGREGEGRIGERITEREPSGRRPRRPAGELVTGERPVQREQVRRGEPSVLQREQEAERRERERLSEAKRRTEAERIEKRKFVGVVGQPLGKLQVIYKPHSKAEAGKENIPTYLEPHITAALDRFERTYGPVDDYVQERLGYKTKEEMFDALSATQIDTIALALEKLDKNRAFIIGHQTGIGKGRILAAHVKGEIVKGGKPIFLTASKNLFTDFYRDLTDIGLTEDEIKTLMINADVDIKDQDNKVVIKKHGNRAKANQAVERAIKGALDYNLVLSTYHQINTETRAQRRQLSNLTMNQLLLLDESHNAAGESKTGEFIRDILSSNANGVLFSSATYAKTPKTMALYARTGLLDAFDGDVDNMMNAVTTGGEPYQEVIAAALGRAGAYIRTELDFTGISFRTEIDATNLDRDTKKSDMVSDILRKIVDFDEQFNSAVIEPENKKAKAIAKRTKSVATTLQHSHFAAVAHNAIKQMLLALKIDTTVERTLQALREGKRPVIVLENTMESFLKRFVERNNLNVGDEIKDFDFRNVLLNMLANTLRYNETSSTGSKQTVWVSLEELPLNLQELYHSIERDTKALTELKLPGSPIDEIIYRLEQEGHKVGELTGRGLTLKKTRENSYKLAHRTKIDKTDIIYDFNFGDTDVLVANVAAAEGVSIHSSENFKNRQQRQMITTQPASDINKTIQLFGRVNRTGQVVPPEYIMCMTALPSEIRPAAVLAKKMRSLNANTSAKTKGIYEQEEVPDIMNKYGDSLTSTYLSEHPDIAVRTGFSAAYDKDADTTNLAKKFTGKAAIFLSNEEQQEFYNWIEPAYNDLIDMLNKTGQNDLISQDLDYKAELIKSQNIFAGEKGNVFQEPASLDLMSVLIQGRPLNTEEINDEIRKAMSKVGLKAEEAGPNDYVYAMVAKLDKAWETFVEQREKEGKKVPQSMVEAYGRADTMLHNIRPGKAFSDPEGNPYIVLEVINSFDKKEYKSNPAAPSAIKVRLAIAHPSKTTTWSLSSLDNLTVFHGNIAKYFNVPADARQERYIANGNIIAAMGIVVGDTDAKQIRPKVINYTMADGSRRQGLLLPKGYKESDLPTSIAMIPEAAVDYLMDMPSGTIHLVAGDARIFKSSPTRCYIEVPKSKARGLKFFGDTKLKALTGEFETYRQSMRADFSSEKLLNILNHLRSRGNSIKSDPTGSGETAREYNNAYRDRPAEDLGFAAPVKLRKIPLKREAAVSEPMSQRRIIRYLSNSLGVPIRGVATFRKKKPGWYNTRTRGIRLKNTEDLRVATHEVGHHIDNYFNNKASKKFPHAWWGIGAELVRLGKAVYGSKRPVGGYKSEGYAEFVFGFLTGGIDLQKEAPRMLRFFENEYLKDNPEMADILYTARDMITQWKEQGAEKRFDAQIAPKLRPSKSARERFSLWWSTTWADVSAPLQRALQENIPSRSLEFGANDPGFLYGFFTQTEGARAKTFVMENTIDLWGNPTGKSLKEVLRPVSDDIKDFIRYVVATRALHLHSREIESGFDHQDALYIYKKYHNPKWEKTAKELSDWNHRVLDYLVEAGGLEAEAARRMKELNPVYIPFLRAFAPDEIRRRPMGVGRGLIKRGKGVYKIIGSGRPIEDPIQSMITQVRRMIAIAHKCVIARALVEVERETPGIAELIEKVSAPIHATTFNAEQIKRQLIDLGIDVMPGDLDDAMLTVFSNSPVFLGKEHIISVVIDGKRQWYELSPELYRVLEDCDQFQLPKLLNLLLGKANRLCRLGATGIHAAFGLIRNPLRDIMDSVVKARYARGPVAFAKGVAKDLSTTGLAKSLGINANEAARRFTDIGGQISGYLGQDRTGIQHLKGEMLANKVAGHAIHTIKHPVEAMRALFGVPESGLRIEEFERALKDWMSKHQPQGGEPPPDAIVYAFQLASDQTINYRRAGLYGRWLNGMTTFWNANTQDLSKVYRTLRERPKSAMLWALGFLTLPALGIWWLNKDEKWYKELPAWEKANNIHIPVYRRIKQIPILGRLVAKYKTGEEIDYVLRLPVPFLIGHIFQSMPVTIVDALYTVEPDKIKDFLGEVYNADIKPLLEWPAAVRPWLDIRRNKDWAGRPIITKSMEGKLPEDQYNNYTTEFAKIIGRMFNQSPAQIEYALNAYSGGLYRRIEKGAELTFGEREKELSPKDWPLVGTLFVRDPFAPKKSIENFYDELDRLNRMYQSGRIKAGTDLAAKLRRYNYISRKYMSPLWKILRKAETIEKRKKVYRKMSDLMEKANRKSQPEAKEKPAGKISGIINLLPTKKRTAKKKGWDERLAG